MTFGQRLGTGFFPVITLELPVWRESELEHDLSALWRRINAAQRHGGFYHFIHLNFLKTLSSTFTCIKKKRRRIVTLDMFAWICLACGCSPFTGTCGRQIPYDSPYKQSSSRLPGYPTECREYNGDMGMWRVHYAHTNTELQGSGLILFRVIIT